MVHFVIQEFVTVESGCPTHQPLLHQGQLWLQTNPELWNSPKVDSPELWNSPGQANPELWNSHKADSPEW